MILQKYFAALLSITIVVMTALLAIPSGQINGPAIVQLISIGVAAIGTYLSPLVNISWKGVIKTGIAIVAAIISILDPILVTHGAVNGTEIALMVLAAVNALGVEVGVQIRTDQSTLMPADPTPTTSVNQTIALSDTDRNLLASAIAAPAMALSAPVAPSPALVAPSTIVVPASTFTPAAQAPVPDEPALPENVPVVTAPNPANAVDNTTSINLANLAE